MSTDEERSHGAGRFIIAVYGVFAVSATARALYQLLTEFDKAPIPYSLSGFAAVVYLIATLALSRPGRAWSLVAWAAVITELLGVFAAGAWSFGDPEMFHTPTVWSHFGSGYGYIPAVLPIVGMWWLRRTAPLLRGDDD